MVKIASVIWQDYQGKTRQSIVRTADGASDLLIALQAASWARISQYWESDVMGPLGIPANNAYTQTAICVVLFFQTDAGSLVKLTLPAPVYEGAANPTGIFMADGETVDPAQITDLIAAAIGTLCDPAGNLVSSFVAGSLQRTRLDLPATG